MRRRMAQLATDGQADCSARFAGNLSITTGSVNRSSG
jgi:hypothetical protein